MSIVILALLVVALNLPFGAYRATVRRFSPQWFLAIHLPIPFIFVLRVTSGHSYRVIPALVVAAVVGQVLGAWGCDRVRAARGAPAVAPVPPDDRPADTR